MECHLRMLQRISAYPYQLSIGGFQPLLYLEPNLFKGAK